MPRKKKTAKNEAPKREKKVANPQVMKLKTKSKIQDDESSLIPVKTELIPEVQEFIPDEDSLDAMIPPGVPVTKKLVPTNAHEQFCVNVWNEAGRLFRRGEVLTEKELKIKEQIKKKKNQGEPFNVAEQKLEMVQKIVMKRTGLTEEEYLQGQKELLQKEWGQLDLKVSEAEVWALRVEAQRIGEAARQKILENERTGKLDVDRMMANANQDLRALGGRQVDEDYDDEIPQRRELERAILAQKAEISESLILERIPSVIPFGSPIMSDHVHHNNEWKRFETKQLLVVQTTKEEYVYVWALDMGLCYTLKEDSFLPKQFLFNSIKDVENAGILATQIQRQAVSMQYICYMQEWLKQWVGKKATKVFLKFAHGDDGDDDLAANCEDQLESCD